MAGYLLFAGVVPCTQCIIGCVYFGLWCMPSGERGYIVANSKSKQEISLNISADLWNSIVDIPKDEMHPDDESDLRHHIHAIQNILYAQLFIKKHGRL